MRLQEIYNRYKCQEIIVTYEYKDIDASGITLSLNMYI